MTDKLMRYTAFININNFFEIDIVIDFTCLEILCTEIYSSFNILAAHFNAVTVVRGLF
ncbi:MAG: hypothetical protein ABFR82_16265 [Nitrospirota bacterium]